jgi:serine/threonine-protein kinase
LHHENIVRVFEFSASREDRAYVVGEYIDGINLEEHVARSGCPSMHQLAHIGFQVASALEHAHTQGCIHGDVKPENVLLMPTGQVKLTDFGLVGLWSEKPSGEPMSSPAFMAPQTLAGPVTDPRVDVYSLGALLYFLAVGHGPVEGTNDATVVTMRAVFSGHIRPLSQVNPDLPSELIAIVDKAMTPTAGHRIQTMAVLKQRIAAFMQDVGRERRPQSTEIEGRRDARPTVPTPEPTRRTDVTAMESTTRKRHRSQFLVLGAIALVPLILAAILLATRTRGCSALELPPPPAQTEPTSP